MSGRLIVGLWWTELTQCDDRLLSHDERVRADRFHRRDDRRLFVGGRTWLRRMLADWLGMESASLEFGYGPNGKPFLDKPAGAPEFNLSHAGRLAVLAVCEAHPVGVDVEQLTSGVYDRAAAATVLSGRECDEIDTATHPDAAFLRAWTRKEAYAKVSGHGLERRLADLTLSEPGSATVLHRGIRVTDVTIDIPHVIAAVAGPADHTVEMWGRA